MSKKADNPTETVLEQQFKVDSILQTVAPQGANGMWHSYVISQGPNMINGVRAGTRSEVAILLEEMVERLNERRAGKSRAKGKG
jgi:hypothetical protein